MSGGCDSGTCTYCYNIRARAGCQWDGGVCWLRRKLSETELSSHCVSEKAASNVVPDISRDESKQESIWQHALLEPEQAARLLLHRKVINAPWAWKQEYLVQPTPPARGGTLTPVANFSSPSNRAGSGHQAIPDIVCGMEFEPHGWLLATAGVSKQVRLYSLASGLEEGNCSLQSSPLRVHRLASKLSSLTWHPDQPGVVTVGDYDGVVVQLDVESGHVVAEGDEHSGRRVWSVSHSQSRPHLVASASEDGSVIFWAGKFLGEVVGKLTPNPNPKPNPGKSGGPGACAVTAVQFSPFDEYGLAVACADSRAYVYDLRCTSHPVSILQGHSRPVSYVKYLSRDALVTASTDATLKTWSLPLANSNTNQMSALPGLGNKTYSGHPNTKNFVGLSVYPEEGLVACGSEGSSVYAYSLAWEVPLASASLMEGGSCNPDALCSAVAWQPAGSLPPGNSPLLAAASSDGHIKVLGLDLVE